MTNDLETQQRSPKRKRKLRKVREILDAEEVAPEIRIIDGLRYVVPYSFVMRTYAKQRWFDKSILDVGRIISELVHNYFSEAAIISASACNTYLNYRTYSNCRTAK